MFRKLVLALGATTVIAAAALAPTSASAWGWHHNHHNHWGHHGFGFGIYAPTNVDGGDCYRVKRTFERRDGSIGVRYVLVCD
jgi:hypothetical protein